MALIIMYIDEGGNNDYYFLLHNFLHLFHLVSRFHGFFLGRVGVEVDYLLKQPPGMHCSHFAPES